MTKIKLQSLTYALLVASLPASAQDAAPQPAPPTTEAEGGTSEDFERGFGAEGGMSEADKGTTDADRLKIGGTLAADLYVFGTRDRDYLKNLNTLWVYADAQLREDVRAFAKFRGVVDALPTGGAVGASIPAARSDVEELKLMFNAGKAVFFTAGRQKIKWGAGKFWNPTDVMNSARRDLRYTDDRRSGMDLLKTHVPVGPANFYLVQGFNGATRVNEIAHAARVEVPWSSGEASLSVAKRRGENTVLGADLSFAVWDLDLHAEVAGSSPSNQLRFGPTGPVATNGTHVSWVAGASYELPYGDNDSLSLIVEYFRNGDGYAKADYAWPIANGAYAPYYLAKQYLLAMLLVPTPGSWNDTTFSLLNLFNLEDGSAYTKFTTGFSFLRDLTWQIGASLNYGKSDGELRFGGQRYGLETRLLANF